MIDWIMNFQFNSQLGLFFYWLPMALALFGFGCEFYLAYKNDLNDRAWHEKDPTAYPTYSPSLTLGEIVGGIVVSFIPLLNIWTSITTTIPIVLTVLRELLDIPLVPKRDR